jgi:hypothetical protein
MPIPTVPVTAPTIASKAKQHHPNATTQHDDIKINPFLHEEKSLAITEKDIEQDAVRKSLQLRIVGQLQCIKSLEAQLQDALSLVNARNKLIGQLQAKVKAVGDGNNNQDERAFAAQLSEQRMSEVVDKYKVQ